MPLKEIIKQRKNKRMFNRLFLLGIVSGLVSGFISVLYGTYYLYSVGADFSKVASNPKIILGCFFGSLIASMGYWLLRKISKQNTDIIFNMLFFALSFVTLIAPFFALPYNLKSPELFPGFAVPMHFLPALLWLCLKPAFVADIADNRKDIFS
jgi:uncharacterized membrane protein